MNSCSVHKYEKEKWKVEDRGAAPGWLIMHGISFKIIATLC